MSDEVHVRQEVDPSRLRWPDDDECEDDSGLGGNRSYFDMRRLSFEHVEPLILSEQNFAALIIQGIDYDDAIELVEENTGDRFYKWFFDLEPGVASSVTALSAFGCIPFTSCNGAAFGGSHLETMPLVGFFAKPDQVPILIEAAAHAGVGLVNDTEDYGAIVLFSDDIPKLQAFALHLAKIGGKRP